jgi:GDPmannose 4,6-dehydratase
MKTAFVTGVTGQDGSYLTELLLEKGYTVHGFARRTSNHQNLLRINVYLQHPRFKLHIGDITDASSVQNTLTSVFPSDASGTLEIYNLAAQSHVHHSFSMPDYTAKADGLGPLYILEWIRSQKDHSRIRFYQASTSELFGKVKEVPQTETTPFHPRSPYGVAKLYAYWIVRNYRESYGMFAANGILYNHESPRRGEDFVTRKITKGIADIVKGKQTQIDIGNLDAKRDWGHARDYVEGMWRILQADVADDFVLATGTQHTVREFIDLSYRFATGHTLTWSGSGVDEKGHDSVTGDLRICVNPQFFRPAEVETLLGDPSKALTVLGWKPTTPFSGLVNEMMEGDLAQP